MDWHHLFDLLSAGRDIYSELKNMIVWNKDNGGMGSMYRSKHELILVFKNGTAPHQSSDISVRCDFLSKEAAQWNRDVISPGHGVQLE